MLRVRCSIWSAKFRSMEADMTQLVGSAIAIGMGVAVAIAMAFAALWSKRRA